MTFIVSSRLEILLFVPSMQPDPSNHVLKVSTDPRLQGCNCFSDRCPLSVVRCVCGFWVEEGLVPDPIVWTVDEQTDGSLVSAACSQTELNVIRFSSRNL